MKVLMLISAGLVACWILAVEWLIPPERAEWTGGVVWYCGLVNLATCWFSGAVMHRVARMRHDALPSAIMGTTAIRLSFAGMAIILAAILALWPLQALCVWMVVGYLLMLTVETTAAVRWLIRGTS